LRTGERIAQSGRTGFRLQDTGYRIQELSGQSAVGRKIGLKIKDERLSIKECMAQSAERMAQSEKAGFRIQELSRLKAKG
jgi:hypothetical protein